MPSRIRVLSDQVANQIAAGEVVERPASILKELVENSLDAGATSLDVAWEEGGRRLLEVADNGCGMGRDDLYLALERHATSKIRSAHDLQALGTYGFRGEALPSIAGVTRFEMQSADEDGHGYRLRSEFGVTKGVEPAPRAKGTTVTVRDIFAQLPARRQFLKSAETENAHVWATLTRLALATPAVRWAVRPARGMELTLPAAQDLKQRMALLSGERMSRLVSFADGAPPWRMHGYLSPPDLCYRDRNHLYLFVNGRPVRDRLMLSALSSGWDGFFQKGAFPAVVLFLEIPAEAVDVNVHPTKSEVRFREPQRVFPWISRATREAWGAAKGELPSFYAAPSKAFYGGRAASRPDAPDDALNNAPNNAPNSAAPSPDRYYWQHAPHAHSRDTLKAMWDAFLPNAPYTTSATSLDRPYGTPPPAMMVAEAQTLEAGAASPVRYLGAFMDTYILAEHRVNSADRTDSVGGAAELWIVDQHVAHERVLFERLFRQRHIPAAQPLLPPRVVNVGRSAMAMLEPFMEELRGVGLDVEPFGESSITVRALPDFLMNRDPEQLMEDLMARVGEGGRPDLDHFRADLNAELACRSAVKKNHALDPAQAQALLELLMACDTPLTCPHGRPVVKKISLAELERGFGRR
jgi:DNA mismatch repair protein MutL